MQTPRIALKIWRVRISFHALIDLFAILVSVWFAVDGLRTGRAEVPVPAVDITYDRRDDPSRYWVTIAVLALGAILFTIDLLDPGLLGVA